MFRCSFGNSLSPWVTVLQVGLNIPVLEETFVAQDLHCSTVSTNKLQAVQGMVCNHSDSVWESWGRSTLVPALPWDLAFILLGHKTSALQGQDTATERKANAGWVGRCHTLIRSPRCGILSFQPCCKQGPKHRAMGYISAKLQQCCVSGHREDAGAPHLLIQVSWLSWDMAQFLFALLVMSISAPGCLLEGAAPCASLEPTHDVLKPICRELLLS